MTDYLEFSLIIFAVIVFFFSFLIFLKVGNFIFTYIYDKQNMLSAPVLLTICVGVIYFLLPTEDLNEKLFKIVTKDEVQEYQNVVKDFDNDYDKDNPATRDEALAQGFFNFL